MEYSLQDLKREAEEQRDKFNSYMRDNYQFAKKLGFSPAEATVLKGKSRETTIRLAIERGYIKDETDPLATSQS